jgi:hypothetical protein
MPGKKRQTVADHLRLAMEQTVEDARHEVKTLLHAFVDAAHTSASPNEAKLSALRQGIEVYALAMLEYGKVLGQDRMFVTFQHALRVEEDRRRQAQEHAEAESIVDALPPEVRERVKAKLEANGKPLTESFALELDEGTGPSFVDALLKDDDTKGGK